MLVEFAKEDLEARRKTLFHDEKGQLLCWGIYDFAYKYRDRIFDVSGNELAYVQKDITRDGLVEYFDSNDHKIAALRKTKDGLFLDQEGNTRPLSELFGFSDGKLQVQKKEDCLLGIMTLYGMIEMER